MQAYTDRQVEFWQNLHLRQPPNRNLLEGQSELHEYHMADLVVVADVLLHV